MRYAIPVILGTVALLGALAVAILSANQLLVGKTWLLPYLYGACVVLLLMALGLAVRTASTEKQERLSDSKSQSSFGNITFAPQFTQSAGDVSSRSDSKVAAATAVAKKRQGPHLQFINAPTAFVGSSNAVLLADETTKDPNACVATFKNPPAASGEEAEYAPDVTAHLTYVSDDGARIDIDYGTWIGEYTHSADFPPGKTHKLILSIKPRDDRPVVALDNPHRYDPRKYRYTHGGILSSPDQKPLMLGACRLDIALVCSGVTVYEGCFRCVVKEDGTMAVTSAG